MMTLRDLKKIFLVGAESSRAVLTCLGKFWRPKKRARSVDASPSNLNSSDDDIAVSSKAHNRCKKKLHSSCGIGFKKAKKDFIATNR